MATYRSLVTDQTANLVLPNGGRGFESRRRRLVPAGVAKWPCTPLVKELHGFESHHRLYGRMAEQSNAIACRAIPPRVQISLRPLCQRSRCWSCADPVSRSSGVRFPPLALQLAPMPRMARHHSGKVEEGEFKSRRSLWRGEVGGEAERISLETIQTRKDLPGSNPGPRAPTWRSRQVVCQLVRNQPGTSRSLAGSNPVCAAIDGRLAELG